MIYKLTSILIFAFAMFGTALSQTREIKVDFSIDGFSKGEYHYSTVEAIEASNNQSFIGLTAFNKEAHLLGDLSFRIYAIDGWEAWQSMELYHEVELEDRTVFEAAPITVSFDSIQFRSNHITDNAWTFRLYFPQGNGEVEIENTGKKSTAVAGCPLPIYCSRYCWGENDCPADSTPTPTVPTHLIVHHSAGFNTNTNYKDVVSYYWDFHVNTNGWDDIGYNWLVDPNGVIYEGRGSGVQGSHFSCMNSYTLGICMIGNFESQAPTDTSIGSLLNILAYEASNFNIDPDGMSVHSTSQLNLFNISSHRDGNSSTAPIGCPKGTTCPGDSLYSKLPEIRQRLASKSCMQGVNIEEKELSVWEVYPNPAKEIVEIKGTEEIVEVSIFDLSGKEKALDINYTNSREAKVNVIELQEGMYLLKVKGEDSERILKLMKSK
ncbi:N-acetylmuramoyl-L-alanine amidase [Owenweeksia hongkongensis DSM 17368]|uniref:N-acetylmuramoyl-L-alanine amidase n=1 Tax=Owenweeksia hongkongensis (strain DSM 17368 / CIP 108786 / JCM 12287 / NRRL B-23963 / UST20020801) TaxID=926562 RepID=G8R5L1_OWEHD|nr:N-acetylmuramoyl-L-alanine amidase [Owenweeksia hongkongensis]AEV33285.1 N-acetylmuramoyl-L-alanine amidase [Owenweeksia hongkongensis DSM 17368]